MTKLYAYNNVKLTEIPEGAYSVVMREVSSGGYCLAVSTAPFCVKSSIGATGVCHDLTAETTGYRYLFETWIEENIDSGSADADWGQFDPDAYAWVWSSADIADDDGIVIYSASEPVRVADTPNASIAWYSGPSGAVTIPPNWPTPGIKVTASVIDGGTLEAKWYKNGKLVSRKTVDELFRPSTKAKGNFEIYCVVVNSVDGVTARAQSNTVTLKVSNAAVQLLDWCTGLALGLAGEPVPRSKLQQKGGI